MTLLPLSFLVGAVAPLLSVTDSASVRPVPAPKAIVAPAPVKRDTVVSVASVATATPTIDAGIELASVSPTPAPVAVAAPALAAGGWTFAAGMVRMPSWVSGTRTGLIHAAQADSIVVEKDEHRMTLFAAGEAVGTYQVAIGQTTGKKERIGDKRTPEGLYHIDAKNPNSRFHLALHVSYPNADDIARAQQLGVATGGDIMIHGLPNGQGAAGITHRNYDWTNGCVAVTDKEIEEIFGAVPVGTPVRIKR